MWFGFELCLDCNACDWAATGGGVRCSVGLRIHFGLELVFVCVKFKYHSCCLRRRPSQAQIPDYHLGSGVSTEYILRLQNVEAARVVAWLLASIWLLESGSKVRILEQKVHM